jgi:hypothetical protein
MGFPFSHVSKKDYKSKQTSDIEWAINVANAIDRCKALCYYEENDVTSFKSSLLLMIFFKIIFNNSA